MKPKAVRCKASWDVEWPGHRCSLYRKHCQNKTTDPSGYCHLHRLLDPRRRGIKEQEAR